MKHNSSRMRRRLAPLLTVVAGFVASPVLGGLTDTTWIGGASGLWSATSNWSSGRPNNNVPAGATYNALIDGGAVGSSAVTLDMNATITGLWINSRLSRTKQKLYVADGYDDILIFSFVRDSYRNGLHFLLPPRTCRTGKFDRANSR